MQTSDPAVILRRARVRAGMTQAELAARSGTSQATVSAYESGVKRPGVDTFNRLLGAMGFEMAIRRVRSRNFRPSRAQQRRAGRVLADVLELAEALPSSHARELRYPRLAGRLHTSA